mgnify:CR=1 FL=1
MLAIAPLLLVYGIIRFVWVRRRYERHMRDEPE